MDKVTLPGGMIRHIPETGFEQALFEKLFDASGCFQTDRLMPSRPATDAWIEAGSWQADGRLACTLVIRPTAFSLSKLLVEIEALDIYLSVLERPAPVSEHFRVAIWWEMPANAYSPQDQANEWGFAPVLMEGK